MRELPIRKVALNACLTLVPGLMMPLWKVTQTIFRLAASPASKLIGALELAVVFSVVAILPVFCYALYRNEGTFRIAERLRLLSLAAALVLCALTPGYLGWIDSWDSSAATKIGELVDGLADLSYVLLLVSFFQHRDNDSGDGVAISRFLRVVTKVAVIALGIIAAFFLLLAAGSPFEYYFELRPTVLQMGRTPPPVSAVIKEAVFRALAQIGLFAGPYVVYQSLKNSSETATTIKPAE